MARILFIDQYASLGGGQRILLDVVEAFAKEGHACFAALPGEGEVTRALDKLGVQHRPLAVPELNAGAKGLGDAIKFLQGSMKMGRQIRALAAEFAIDIVYVNGPRCVLGSVLSKPKKAVVAIHLIHGGIERRILAWCFAKPCVKLVTFCSHLAMQPFEGLEKGRVVENWVSPGILSAPNRRDEVRAELNLKDEVAVGVLGRISPFKGQALLCKALLPDLTEAGRIRLFIAGASDHESGDDLPKSPYITELGKVADTAKFLDAMDLLAVPSLWEEPFGLVAVEGMSRALPIVATRSGCLPEIVQDGVTGLIADRTEESLRAAIESLASDAPRRRQMGEAGKSVAQDRFDPQRKLRELIDLVETSR